MSKYSFSHITPKIEELSALCRNNYNIEPELYQKYEVKRGLRDINGKGVVAGLTDISEVCSSKTVNGESVPCDGKLYYRGIDIEDIVKGFIDEKRFGFEETVYLLLFGELPERLGNKSAVVVLMLVEPCLTVIQAVHGEKIYGLR